jgi:organic radical activating enzyme
MSIVNSNTLPVMEQFYSLQGEGHYQGQAAYFIRLAGCDVGCVWCDVKESWDASSHPQVSVISLVNEAISSGTKIVVITGGEPLMHDLTELTKELRAAGLRTHLETSGTRPISGTWDWICLSPKKFKAPLDEFVPLADELKVVAFNSSDLKWAEEYASITNDKCLLYLQPEWDKSSTITPILIDYIQKNTKWTLSLQVHKYLQVR